VTNLRAILRATGIVAALGAVGGALGGVVVALGLTARIIVRKWSGVDAIIGDTLFFTAVSASLGAVYGIVLGPVLGWLFMRSVPLGRAIGETAFAAALGVGIAVAFPVWGLSLLVFPILTATLAAARLRFTSTRSTGRLESIRP
jgi:hypothetical protein